MTKEISFSTYILIAIVFTIMGPVLVFTISPLRELFGECVCREACQNIEDEKILKICEKLCLKMFFI